MAIRVEGDAKKLVESIITSNREALLKEVSARVGEVLDAMVKMLESAYEEALRRYEAVIVEAYRAFEDELKSLRAMMDKDYKLEKQTLEYEAVSRVIENVYQRMLTIEEKAREALYEKLLKELNDAGLLEGRDVTVVTGEVDLALVKNLVRSLGVNVEIRADPRVEGGFVVKLGGGGFYDYTFRTIFETLKPVLMSKAKRALLEG